MRQRSGGGDEGREELGAKSGTEDRRRRWMEDWEE